MFEAEIKYTAGASFRLPGERLSDAIATDTYFDAPDGTYCASGRELRLRAIDGQTLLTAKGPPFDAATGSREEFETGVADAAAMTAILANLGFVARMRYAKRCRRSRDAYRGLELAVTEVTVDFAPQTFVEIEHLAVSLTAAKAALPVIRAYAARLGLTRECPEPYTDLYRAARGAARPAASNRA